MSNNWFYGEILKVVFPILDGEDLVSCMLVCRQWRDIAKDDFFWKCVCTRKWPSVCKKAPPGTTYHKLYSTFSKPPRNQPPPLPRLSFEDLVFYIDLWTHETLLLSDAVPGSTLRVGLKSVPPGVPDALRLHLDSPDCKMVMQVEPILTVSRVPAVTVSVLVSRRDTNKMACIVNKGVFDYVDSSASRALAYEYLRFSPRHPFISDIRAWVSLLFLSRGSAFIDVFGVEIDFCDAATSENEVLWLLDMLDWK